MRADLVSVCPGCNIASASQPWAISPSARAGCAEGSPNGPAARTLPSRREASWTATWAASARRSASRSRRVAERPRSAAASACLAAFFAASWASSSTAANPRHAAATSRHTSAPDSRSEAVSDALPLKREDAWPHQSARSTVLAPPPSLSAWRSSTSPIPTHLPSAPRSASGLPSGIATEDPPAANSASGLAPSGLARPTPTGHRPPAPPPANPSP